MLSKRERDELRQKLKRLGTAQGDEWNDLRDDLTFALPALLDAADREQALREGIKTILREGEHSQATHDKLWRLLNDTTGGHHGDE